MLIKYLTSGTSHQAAPAGHWRGPSQPGDGAREEPYRGGREGVGLLQSHPGLRLREIKYLQKFNNYWLQFEPLQEYRAVLARGGFLSSELGNPSRPDSPTNFLDLTKQIKLENWLQSTQLIHYINVSWSMKRSPSLKIWNSLRILESKSCHLVEIKVCYFIVLLPRQNLKLSYIGTPTLNLRSCTRRKKLFKLTQLSPPSAG